MSEFDRPEAKPVFFIKLRTELTQVCPLSALGREQAAALAPYGDGPCAGPSGDLGTPPRLCHGGDPGHHDARLEPALREIDVGVWQGRAIPDIQAEDAAAYAGWRAGTHRPEEGVDWSPFAAPVQQAIRQEAVSGGARTLLFVCHGA